MTTRAEQCEETREKIVAAAVEAFSELGFRGASTREIASRAATNQGLITYHFRSKELLWQAAAEKIFAGLRATLANLRQAAGGDAREQARESIRRYVRFAAAHPELFRLMVEEGKTGDRRMQWLVDTHLKPFYEGFRQLVGATLVTPDEALIAHAFYALAGASSLMFAVAPECRRLTGLNPARKQVIEAHAEFVSRLFVP
jgi:AcrR family transcriptional regulator